ncbi:MAG: hypothetical protein ACJA1N_002055 [Saprospiraceae bacterium]|jgi:hypothetical protein
MIEMPKTSMTPIYADFFWNYYKINISVNISDFGVTSVSISKERYSKTVKRINSGFSVYGLKIIV